MSVWKGVDKWKAKPIELLRVTPGMIASLRARLPLGLQLWSATH
jgi:hypothetical protein